MRIISCLTIALALTACESFPEYVPPESGDVAFIRFTTAGTKTATKVYSDERCIDPRQVGTHEDFIKVPANRPMFVERDWNLVSPFRVTFSLETGKYYELQYGQGYPKSYLTLLPLDGNRRWIYAGPPKEVVTESDIVRYPLMLPLKRFECARAKANQPQSTRTEV